MKRIIPFLVMLSCAAQAQTVDSAAADTGKHEYKSGDHELFLMPTAHTMPARRSYLGSYEVVLLNYTLAVGPSTHLGLYVLPLPHFDGGLAAVSVTILAKHTYYNSPAFSAAGWGMVNIAGVFMVLGNTFSYETENIGFHGGFGFAGITLFRNDESLQGFFLLGTKAKLCSWLYAIAEYSNTPKELLDANKEFSGLSMAGLRYRDKYFVLDLAAAKFFGNNSDVFPVVKAVVYF